MENLEFHYKFEKGITKVYEFLPIVSSYTSPKSLISIVGYNENKQKLPKTHLQKEENPYNIEKNDLLVFGSMLSYFFPYIPQKKHPEKNFWFSVRELLKLHEKKA